MQIAQIVADKVAVQGPQTDGGLRVTAWTGQDQSVDVAKLLAIPAGRQVRITYEVLDDASA